MGDLDLNQLEQDPASFRDALPVEIDGVMRSYGRSLREWQRRNHADVDPALRCIAGYGDEAAVKHWYVYHEMCRGSAKTTAAAANMLYLLWASKRRLMMGVYAADADQARITRDMIAGMVSECAWLSSRIRVDKNTVLNVKTGGEFRVQSSDAASAFGQNLDAVYLDEFAAWDAGAINLWHAVISTAAKRRRCLVHISSNPGWTSSFQAPIVEQIKSDPAWCFVSRTQPAEWITQAALDQQRKLLTSQAYSRLWAGAWSNDAGVGLNQCELDRCVSLSGPSQFKPNGILEVVIGLDMGWKRDHCGIVALGLDVQNQRVVLCDRKRFSPKDYEDGQIRVEDVRLAIHEFRARFRAQNIISDAWQSVALMQRLREEGFNSTIMWESTTGNKDREAKALLEVLHEKALFLYPCDLVDDLRRCRIIERPTGLRVDFVRDAATGHGDEGSALLCCLPICLDTLRQFASGEADYDYGQEAQQPVSSNYGRASDPFLYSETRPHNSAPMPGWH